MARRALTYATVVAGLLLTGVSAGPASPAGFALESSCGSVVDKYGMRVGEELWIGLPVLENHADAPITVTGATAVHPPAGLRVTGFSAYDGSEGTALSADAAMMRPYENLALKPIRIPARTATTVYLMVHLRLTRPGSYTVDSFQVAYAKEGHRYTQTVGCGAELSSLPYED
ncbi:hypothetical protein [Streptomyces sp. NPDC050738]|uniref:hypothetical protein n=1 Tax=Streptomyces sp. NPDC050738 TaxID=3154744 RepID=UPI0034444D8D